MWLDEIEFRHQYDDNTWIPSHTKTIYDQILDDAHKDRERMARVLRELAKVVISLSSEDVLSIRGIDPNFPPAPQLRAYAKAYDDLSDDAKELLEETWKMKPNRSSFS